MAAGAVSLRKSHDIEESRIVFPCIAWKILCVLYESSYGNRKRDIPTGYGGYWL